MTKWYNQKWLMLHWFECRYAQRSLGLALAVLVHKVAPHWAHLFNSGSVSALGAPRHMIVNVEAEKPPHLPFFRQWLFVDQFTGPVQTPMDHHQLLLPCPGLLARFGRKFSLRNLHGSVARFKLIPHSECAVGFLSNPLQNTTPSMTTDDASMGAGDSWRFWEPDRINFSIKLSP